MENAANAPVSRVERLLAVAAAGIAALSFLALMTVLAAPLFGVSGESWTHPGWQALVLVSYFGFPLAFCLVVAVIGIRIASNRHAERRSDGQG